MDSVIDGKLHFHDGGGTGSGWINGTEASHWIAAGDNGMNGIAGQWPPTTAATTYVMSATDWPSVDWPMAIMVNGTAMRDSWTGEGSWGQFWIGVNGTCIDRSPAAGYWCAPRAPRRISVPNHPVGLNPNSSMLPHFPYANATGGVVHSWRPSHWYTNMFEIGGNSHAGPNATFNFSRGGFQGGEGEPMGAEWYVENILEELDMGREWYFDKVERTLFYAPNGTSVPPTTGFEATNLTVLFNISGSQTTPVANISVRGLQIRDAAYTYFEPHGLPSGGDWALQPQGAITMHGTEGARVENNLFTRLDGNAIFTGGYHRGLRITNNEFSFVGASAIASWGWTGECLNEKCDQKLPTGVMMGPDGRAGNQAIGTYIASNIAREIGLWQKQASFYFQVQILSIHPLSHCCFFRQWELRRS